VVTKSGPKVGDIVTYRNVLGDVGLGEVVFVHRADLIDLRAVNTAGAPVMYQVPRDDSGGLWNTWKLGTE
jgi:hypothetical protein